MEAVAITLDIDWAPDFVIDHVAGLLAAAQVPATWFVTHASPAVERLRQRPDLFELGVHPNLMAGSTHGDSPDAVLAHMCALVPEAVSLRTHALVQSTPLFARVVQQTPWVNDVSLFLPYVPHLRPAAFRVGGGVLCRLPCFWSDAQEMSQPEPDWRVAEGWLEMPGLKVFAFHPIHIALNSGNVGAYEALKRQVPQLDQAQVQDVDRLAQHAPGTRTAFLGLLERLTGDARVGTIREHGERWREEFSA